MAFSFAGVSSAPVPPSGSVIDEAHKLGSCSSVRRLLGPRGGEDLGLAHVDPRSRRSVPAPVHTRGESMFLASFPED